MSMEQVILLIEDEPGMRRFLRASLTEHGFRLVESDTGQDGIVQATTRNPDLILLDLGLPDMDGMAVTQRIRDVMTTPILILSARGREGDKVAALDAGADDYLTKPFGIPELLARIRVALRNRLRVEQPEPVFEREGLKIDTRCRQVFVDGREVHLTPIEYRLLTSLVRNAGRVVTHRQLLKDAWGPAYENQKQYLRVYMVQLRRKLEADPARPRFLITEPGVGYRFRID